MEQKDDRPLPHHIRRPRLTARYPQKVQATEEKALQTKGAESRADTEHVITRHVVFGIHPCVKITSLIQDAFLAINVIFDMLRQRRSPSRSQPKVVQKDPLLYWRSLKTIGLCVSRFLSEKFYSTWEGKNGIKITPSNSPRAPGT